MAAVKADIVASAKSRKENAERTIEEVHTELDGREKKRESKDIQFRKKKHKDDENAKNQDEGKLLQMR